MIAQFELATVITEAHVVTPALTKYRLATWTHVLLLVRHFTGCFRFSLASYRPFSLPASTGPGEWLKDWSTAGEEIDRHTTVARLASTDLTGREKQVGRRHTIVFTSPPEDGEQSLPSWATSPSYVFINCGDGCENLPGNTAGVQELQVAGVRDPLKRAKEKVATSSPSVDTRRIDSEPSESLVLAVSLARSELCTQVDLYGLPFSGKSWDGAQRRMSNDTAAVENAIAKLLMTNATSIVSSPVCAYDPFLVQS